MYLTQVFIKEGGIVIEYESQLKLFIIYTEQSFLDGLLLCFQL